MKWKGGHKAAERRWLRKNPERAIWWAMKSRCSRLDCWKNYGARGIKVLYKSYEEFIQDVGRRPNKAYTIDRINNDGNYEPGNCRWVTRHIQNLNTRRSALAIH